METLKGLKRTHYCGDLRMDNVGEEVILNGWVQKKRNLGGLVFVDLRDIRGISQIIFDADVSKDAFEKAEKLGEEIKKANGEDTTYLTVLASSGSFMVFSEGGIGTVLKDDMKLPQPANMPEQDSITLPTVTMEGLSEIDADHIIVIATESDKADLEASSVWSQIRAVKDGNVTILDASPYFSQAYNPIGRELILESVKDAVIK